MTYFITICCYGTRLPGDPRGTTTDNHDIYGTPFKPGNPILHQKSREAMAQEPYQLDLPRRDVEMHTIQEVCEYREWILLACHVRKTHLQTVLHANHSPERVGSDLTSYGSRRLNEAGFDHAERKRWAGHQSNPYLWEVDAVQAAIRYTLHQQGEAMQMYLHPELRAFDFREYRHEIDVGLRRFFREHGVIRSPP